MSKTALNWKVVGAAGEGVKSTGLLFSKTCLRHGLYTFDYTDYPSLIRGGHNTYQVHASTKKVHSQEKLVDILVTLNKNGLDLHLEELHPESVIIIDAKEAQVDVSQLSLPNIYDIPLLEIAKKAGGQAVMANNVALGVSVFLLNLDIEILFQVIADTFSSKKPEIAKLNQAVAQAGFDYAAKNLSPLTNISIQKQTPVDNLSMTGNDAVSLGAVAGGLKAYIAYPMTPSSSILHTLASWAEKAEILVKHAEDEIGVINMALGCSFAGVRSAVGTSGGGFCYMTEAYGLAGVAELPIVFFESQRPGPALGMPTWTAQADLLFVINASQDEFPRIVLAPGDVLESFELSKLSFQLAEDYQLPVVVLIDKHLSESAQSLHLDQTEFENSQTSIDTKPQLSQNGFYPRYKDTQSGVSKRTVPGQKDGFYIANSYETDDFGLATESSDIRIQQMDKRFNKLKHANQIIPEQFYFGSDNPQVTFLSFGSTKTAVQAGVEQLNSQGIAAAMLNLSWLWPFPVDQVTQVIKNSQNPIVIEGNKTSQLAKLIRQETGIDIYHKRTRYDGRPFYPHQIVQYAKEILNTN